MMMLALHVAALSSVQHILLDASNLQLNLRPGGAALNLCSLDVPELPRQLDATSKLFAPQASLTAIFDGAAFDGVHADANWECDREMPEATPIKVSFTSRLASADDALVELAQELGAAAQSSPSEPTTTKHMRHVLEQPVLADSPPVYAATLLKSAAGKSKRDKREVCGSGVAPRSSSEDVTVSAHALHCAQAFFKTCGLHRMGDTVHLPTFLPLQRERSLAIVRGLHSIERGVLRFERIERPAALVVSDDRGLRRRCFALAHPPVVMGRNQFFNMLRQADAQREDEQEEELAIEED